MFWYSSYGFTINSDIELPLCTNNTLVSKKKIEIRKMLNISDKSFTQVYKVNITKTKQLICFADELETSLTIDFEHYVLFKFIKHEDDILFLYYFYDDYPQEWKERLVSRFGFAYLLSWLGMIVLHGSAVSDGNKTVCMVADSNGGKSSLAGLFVSDGQFLVADELVVLSKDRNQVVVYNSSCYLHLSEYSISNMPLGRLSVEDIEFTFTNAYMDLSEKKKRVRLIEKTDQYPRACDRVLSIVRGNNDNVWIETPSKTDAFMLLLKHEYTPIVFPFMRKNLLNIIGSIPVQILCFKDCFKQFDLIKSAIKEN